MNLRNTYGLGKHQRANSSVGPVQHLSARIDELASRILSRCPVLEGRVPLILITSANPDEGKTTIAAALGQSMARLSATPVLLTDANAYAPRLRQLFGIDPDHGISDFLRGHLPLKEVALAAPGSNLRIAPIGRSPDPALMLNGESMDRLRLAASEFRCVLLDGGSVEYGGRGIGAHVDGVVMVVDASCTKREQAQQALSAMNLPPERYLGVILNKRRS